MIRSFFSNSLIQKSSVPALALLMSTAALADLVPLGAEWRYLDDGSDQQTAWRSPGFDDSSWSSGSAQLGYGDGDETTVVSYGSDQSSKHITTYFRRQFTVTSLPVQPVSLSVLRDDGVVVYLNGTEVFRDNLPGTAVTADTFASSTVSGAGERTLQTITFGPAPLVVGTNTLAVEIHQADQSSSDISFDLRLSDDAVVRGPYLQLATDSGVTVRWRTVIDRNAVVRFGTDPENLNLQASPIGNPVGIDHEVAIDGLSPDTRYYYSVGDSNGSFLSGASQYFDTHPPIGSDKSTRIWVLGDSGTANSDAAAVRDAYRGFNGGPHADVWLMLGDNAYNDGTDSQYQSAVFDMYPDTLRNSVLWSTLGNHDGHTADSDTQSGPYYDIFSFPKAGESGGLVSGTEAYYSFDYANIHFISLDSYETDRSPTGAMADWLEDNLAQTTQEWIIAFWHHPPYTKGSHDSDTEQRLIEMRTNFLPILESHGVDLVLGGHSHSYERSMLIDGHYGTSNTFGSNDVIDGGDGDPLGDGAYSKSIGGNSGAVYGVAGSSGKITNAALDHPVMITNLIELGSMIIDVDGNQLDAVFLNDNGVIGDSFTIVHEAPPTSPPAAPSGLVASEQSASEIQLTWNDNADNEDSYSIERSTDQNNWSEIASPGTNSTSLTDMALVAETTYYYRVSAVNSHGISAFSNTASATTDAPPDYIDYLAEADIAVSGIVGGTYTATHQTDEAIQIVKEIESGGKKSNRYSYLDHRWMFLIPAGESAIVQATTWASASIDGDTFQFSYSVDGGASWHPLFIVDSSEDSNTVSALLPTLDSDSVLLRVVDTDRNRGNRSLDTIYVNELSIRVSTQPGSPPVAPTGLSVRQLSASSVFLEWMDSSTDEIAFTVERREGDQAWATLDNVGADVTKYTDDTVTPGITYDFRVSAYNAAGNSIPSESVSITPGQGILLIATGRKVKGRLTSELSWEAPDGASVNVIRDGVVIFPVGGAPFNGNVYTDETGIKGSASFVYRICTAAPVECSNDATVAF